MRVSWFNQTPCKGEKHLPRAPERTLVLMVEAATVTPTGDG